MEIRVLLTHISAFEYWRLVGSSAAVMPFKTNVRIAPTPNTEDQQVWEAVQVGNLSLPLHCLVSKKRRQLSNVFYHYAAHPLPRGSVYEIADGMGIVSPELALLQIAPLVSMSELAGLMTEFCGFYTPAEFLSYGLAKREQLTTVTRLKAFSEKVEYLRGLNTFQRALQYAFDRSRSPMETGLALFLSLPLHYGGYALKGLELNKEILLKKADARAFGVDTLRPDICWEAKKVCIEYDSVDFHANLSRVANDAQRKNAFAAAGYTVSTFTKTQLGSWNKTDLFAEQIAKHLGRRIRGSGDEHRLALRKQLFSTRSVLKKQYGVSMRLGQGVVKLGA